MWGRMTMVLRPRTHLVSRLQRPGFFWWVSSDLSASNNAGHTGSGFKNVLRLMVPKIIVCIGLAGFPDYRTNTHRLHRFGENHSTHGLVNQIRTQRDASFVVNLDPAVVELPYKADFDIRGHVNYPTLIAE